MKICGECSRTYSPSSRHRKCPACRERVYKTKYNNHCSCGKLIQQGSRKCIQCSNKRNIGKYSGPYRYVTNQGYVYIRERNHPRAIKNNGLVFEHIIVMEKLLGRFLLPNENVIIKMVLKRTIDVKTLSYGLEVSRTVQGQEI